MALPFFFEQPADTADLVQVYAIIPFLSILFTYGVETAYFRYSNEKDSTALYNTLNLSIFITTVFFSILLYLFRDGIASVFDLTEHPEYINWMLAILFFDTLATLPFARLRQENRPKMYAFVRLTGIVVSLLIVFTFLGFLPSYVAKHPDSFIGTFYNKDIGIGYYFIGNLCGSLFTFLLLWKEFK